MARDYRINQQIRTREVRVVDDKGEQLGIMLLHQALQLAQERELDLVEVAPAAEPPVCRLLDYGKFRYVQARKERESRKGQKFNLLREVRFRTRIGEHDRQAKTRVVKKLLDEGAKVKVSVVFRGREITHPELGVTLLRSVVEELKTEARLEKPPSMEGRVLTIVLAPNPQKQETKPPGQEPEAEQELEGAQA